MKISVKNITLTALMAAFLCVSAPVTIPVGPIPLSAANFVIMLCSVLLGAKRGVAAVALYILIGALGIPVFSGFSGGIGKILEPTGGFIIGYLSLSLIIGALSQKFGEKKWSYPLSMVFGTAVLYIIGTAWYVITTAQPITAALAVCVLPFIIGDTAKIVVASLVAPPLGKILRRNTAL